MTEPTPPATTVQQHVLFVADRLDPAQVRAVTDLIEAATAADGVAPVGEQARLHLRHDVPDPERHLVLQAGGELVGYAHLDQAGTGPDWVAELAVHPAHRHLGHGRALVRAALRQTAPGRLQLWAHGDLPAAGALAASLGFSRTRRLWRMHRDLDDAPAPPRFPAGVRVRSFRPGQDESAWLRLNSRAFAEHPEQGRWTTADLQDRMAERWFDPDGFLLAEGRAEDRAEPALVAAHWTKVHPDGEWAGLGEVYVVAVDPDHQRRGLGKAITLAGLHRLRDTGVREAMLYVNADSAPAVALYTGLGFEHRGTDLMFAPSPDRLSE